MDLLWPQVLLLLVVVPLLIAAYLVVLRRRRVAVRYSSLALVRAALPRYSRLRRHLPFALFLLALVSLIGALARPVQIVTVPYGQATIILALDVSGSMRQADIRPNRLAAAQAAALSFIQSQKPNTQIGLVAFAGYAELIQPPTTDQEALQIAVESLTTARGTDIGGGLLKAIDAIAEIDPNVPRSTDDPSAPGQPTPVPKGAFAPDIIVLLTDGVPTTGVLPAEAAQQAADRGLRVYTIGFGTEQGGNDFGFGGGGFGRGGGFGGPGGFRRGIDEEALKQIATLTDGKYYAASSAGELLNVFQNLPTYLIAKHEVMEISVVFAAAGAALVLLALAFALRWNPLP
jgi:Ca-activated chloride channel family protein